MIVLSIFKLPAIVSMIIVSALSLVIAQFNNRYSLGEIANIFYSGFSKEGVPENIASLINRGGINSMFFTITIVILALSLGGFALRAWNYSNHLRKHRSPIKHKIQGYTSGCNYSSRG